MESQQSLNIPASISNENSSTNFLKNQIWDPKELHPNKFVDQVNLVIIFGGQSAEHEVSCKTALSVLGSIDMNYYDVTLIGIDRQGLWHKHEFTNHNSSDEKGDSFPDQLFAVGTIIQPSEIFSLTDGYETQTVVLPLLHGPYGEDGTIQGLFEMLHVPYVGCGVLSSALSMDKAKAKEVLHFAGIPQAAWKTLHRQDFISSTVPSEQFLRDHHLALFENIISELHLPLFIKPANMGSSIGVSRATNIDSLLTGVIEAFSYDDWIIIEEQIIGREIECAVLGNNELFTSLPGEIQPGADFYDYEDKYVTGTASTLIPAELPNTVISDFQLLARKTYRSLRCSGLARVDGFYDEQNEKLYINEVNTLPGFTPISMYPKMWEASGVFYPDLIHALVFLAIERHGNKHQRT